MTDLSERIQLLRRQQGFSQEELADRLGVSRQAVSKWESGQSTPDLERVVAMSEVFGVTTDYLLKGAAPAGAARAGGPQLAVSAATALDLLGVLAAAAVWHEYQNSLALVLGAALLAAGCMVYAAGTASQPEPARAAARRVFWQRNIWLLSFLQLAVFVNVLGCGIAAPYPLLYHPLPFFFGFWFVYAAVGLAVTLYVRRAARP